MSTQNIGGMYDVKESGFVRRPLVGYRDDELTDPAQLRGPPSAALPLAKT